MISSLVLGDPARWRRRADGRQPAPGTAAAGGARGLFPLKPSP